MTAWHTAREVIFSEKLTPPKGQVVVLAFLGTEPMDGSAPLDPVRVFQLMGWKRAAIGGESPIGEDGPGELIVGLTTDEKAVTIQFPPTGPGDPGWWINLTPDEARGLANIILKKIEETK